ncbi:MAG: NUDIX hydrolase [Acidimicrobiales bacterium]
MVDSPFATDAVPAATVVLLRPVSDNDAVPVPPGHAASGRGFEALMLRRNSALAFAGGAWVFPGGRVDEGDMDPGDPRNALTAARNAAAREAREEAGLTLDPEEFVVLSRWCPPPHAPRRFDTWFFVARAPLGEVTIDGGEIHDHVWITPAQAMARRRAGEVEMIPPTWVTLLTLSRFMGVDQALDAVAAGQPDHFVTRMVEHPDGRRVLLWDGDSGHLSGELDTPGPRHRLWLEDPDWRYERHPTP